MNQKLKKIIKSILFCFVVILSSCEKEGVSTDQKAEVKNNDISIKNVSVKNIPNIISRINPNYGSTFKSSNSKSNLITDSFGSISVENILEVIDSLGNKNYSFTLTPKKRKPNSIFNLVVSNLNGNMGMAIVEYRMAPSFAQEYYNGTKTMSDFTGNILKFPFKPASNLFSKTSYTCVQNIDEVINCEEVIVDGGTIVGTGGGGGTTISDTNTYTGGDGGTVIHNYGGGGGGSVGWICNEYHYLHSGPTSCGDGSGTWVITLFPNSHTNKLSNPKSKTSSTSCCDETNLVGTIGVNLFNLAVSVRDIIGISPRSQESLWLINNATMEQIASISNFLEVNNNSTEAINFSKEIITQLRLNPELALDVNASFKSPTNVDRSSIPFNLTKPENQKFNELYDDLTTSPTFKKLFIDIFQDDKRFNVKFQITEHVYEDNDPAKKEVHAITSQDPTTKNIVIKISKQILVADGTMSQTKIENAKTILHECIHAYLLTITSYPLVGMDIAEVINTVLPTVAQQHDFMYNKMVPVMTKVLEEIRDKVTTEVKRNAVESLNMSGIPSSPIPWNWNEYFKYLSLKGLEEAAFFIDNFPKSSDKETLFIRYYIWGRNNLND